MNRNKILNLFVSNLSNVIVHKVLEKAIDNPEIANFYSKEMKNSFQIAKNYRNKINPIDKVFSLKDKEDTRTKIINKARTELNLRISKGYNNIDISLVEEYVDELLRDLKVL
jgi:hypothetical protein